MAAGRPATCDDSHRRFCARPFRRRQLVRRFGARARKREVGGDYSVLCQKAELSSGEVSHCVIAGEDRSAAGRRQQQAATGKQALQGSGVAWASVSHLDETRTPQSARLVRHSAQHTAHMPPVGFSVLAFPRPRAARYVQYGSDFLRPPSLSPYVYEDANPLQFPPPFIVIPNSILGPVASISLTSRATSSLPPSRPRPFTADSIGHPSSPTQLSPIP